MKRVLSVILIIAMAASIMAMAALPVSAASDEYTVSVGTTKEITLSSAYPIGEVRWEMEDSSVAEFTDFDSGMMIGTSVQYTFSATVLGKKAGSTNFYVYNSSNLQIYQGLILVNEEARVYPVDIGETVTIEFSSAEYSVYYDFTGFPTTTFENPGIAEVVSASTKIVSYYPYDEHLIIQVKGVSAGETGLLIQDGEFSRRVIIRVNSHIHSYTASVTAPTCTEQGYTTHTCACGDRYVDNYVAALGHAFENGVCTRCGEKDPGYTPPTAPTEPTAAPTEPTTAPTEPTTAPAQPCDGGRYCPSYAFNDVKYGDWYHEAVDFAVENGLFNGMSATAFEPNTPMSRAMLVTVLWRYEGQPKGGASSFRDVPSGQWYTNAVAWAAKNGIVDGVGNHHFDPNGKITREQLAAILCRYSDSKGYDTSAQGSFAGFPDKNKVSSWAYDAYSWAVGERLITGNDGRLDPQGSATRAQVATILMRFMEGRQEGDYRLRIETKVETYYSDDGVLLAETNLERPVLKAGADGDEAVCSAFNKRFDSYYSASKSDGDRYYWMTAAELGEMAKMQYERMDKARRADFPYYQYTISVGNSRVAGDLVEVSLDSFSYTGGAHGNYGRTGHHFDLQEGTFFELADLTEEDAKLADAIADEIIRQIAVSGTKNEYFPNYAERIRTFENYIFTLGSDSLTIIFNPYEIGPYASGIREFEISYQKISRYLNERGVRLLFGEGA